MDTKTDARRRWLREDGRRGWYDAATAKEHLGLPEAGRGKEEFSFRGFGERAQPCQHLNFRLPVSRIAREYISVVLSHPVYGSLLWQP